MLDTAILASGGGTHELRGLIPCPLGVSRQIAHIRPRVLLESGAPSTLVALAQAAYGIAIVPSNVRIPRGALRAVPLVQRGAPIGRWLSLAWDPRRFLAPYAERFVEELVAYAQRAFAKSRYTRRAPLLPRPKEPTPELPP